MTDLHLQCRCETVQGHIAHVEKKAGERARCYCRDCQSYAHYLGCTEDALDDLGGTGIYLTTQGGLVFTEGQNQIASLQLSPKGPLRWYARCCNTPLSNTVRNPQVPFVAIPQIAIKEDLAVTISGRELGVFSQDAHGRAPKPSSQKMSIVAALRVARRLLFARLRGEQKRSPFFNAAGEPLSAPKILSREERRLALDQAGFA